MQLLFEYGYEFEKVKGLGLIPGEVNHIVAPGLKNHMGWSDVLDRKSVRTVKRDQPWRSVLLCPFLQSGNG